MSRAVRAVGAYLIQGKYSLTATIFLPLRGGQTYSFIVLY